MTLSELESKDNETINKLIAEKVMGWESASGGPPHLSASDGNTYYFAGFIFRWEDDIGPTQQQWNPCESDADIRLVRAKLAERGLQQAFAHILQEIVRDPKSSLSYWWQLIDASPKAQCLAALLAVEESNG